MGDKNILFITHYPTMYGANQSLFSLIDKLSSSYGVNPVVLMRSKGDLCNFLDDKGIKYYVCNFYWWVYQENGIEKKFVNLIKQFRNILSLLRISSIIKHENIHLIYTNSITLNIGWCLSMLLHLPHIWHIREAMNAYDFRFSIGAILAKKMFGIGNTRYIVISKFLNKSYSGLLPVKMVRMIYNAVELDRKITRTNQLNGTFNICTVGIICEQKNQMDVVKAIKILTQEKGYSNIKLHIIGGAKEGYLENLLEYINRQGLNDIIKMHGNQSNVHELLSTMHLGVNCARDEAFGRVTVEYMLHRLPTIASNSGANPELVKPDISGELYEIYNANDLASKIEKYFNNPELLLRIGDSAYKYARLEYSSEKNTDAVYQVIKESLDK